MPQTIRLTINTDLENALQILRRSTSGTLNTTELIKMAVGEFAQIKNSSMTPAELDSVSSQLFYNWAKNDGSMNINNIANPKKMKPFNPK